jgi:ABC-2 type transport system ATP-binding protein
MKVGEQALYLCGLKGLKKHEIQKRLKYWFEKFEIQSWWNRTLEELSKGMQQKVQFIITVLHNPKLLILDEPFTGFDPINTNLLKQEILQLKKNGATIIFSTHNMASVEEICDNVALINKSKKLLDGTVEAIRGQYATNIYEIEFSGYFNKIGSTQTSDYSILEMIENENSQKIKIQLLNKNITNNALIERMLNFGTVKSFNQHLPSMNDIFIKAVEENNGNLKK